MRRQLILAAFSIALGSAAFDASSAEAQCWDGAWGEWTNTSTPAQCTVGLFGYPVGAQVWNHIPWGWRWERASMRRTLDCNFGHTILWINTREYNLSSGLNVDWWWSTTPHTVQGCSPTLTRNAVNDNQRILRSRCLLQGCPSAQ